MARTAGGAGPTSTTSPPGAADRSVGRGGPEPGSPPCAPATLTQRRMARTRRALAEAAGRLFLAKGYDATTVEDIAAAAEVSPRTFFRYFEHKDGVVTALAQLGIGDVLQAFARRVSRQPVGEALRDAVADVLRAGPLGSADRVPEEGRAFLALLRRTPALRSRWLDEIHQQQPVVASVLQQHVPALADDPDAARVAAGAVLAAMITAVEDWSAGDARSPAEALDRYLGVLARPLLPGTGGSC